MGLFNFSRKSKSDEGKILQTTDGFFNNKPSIKKSRAVVVVHQRKDDRAIAVAKIHSKEEKRTNNMKKPVLSPERHSSLKQLSTVEKRIYYGRKTETGLVPIKKENMIDSGDAVTKNELRQIKKGIDNTPQHKKTHKETLRKWENHFKNKKSRKT